MGSFHQAAPVSWLPGPCAAIHYGRAVDRRALTRRLRRLGLVVGWLLVAAAAGLLVLFVLVPRLVGATPYTVLSGSMEPEFGPGSMVVVKPTPFEEIGMGDVITYQLRSGEPTVVTHRVVGVDSVNGERVLRTQGDANDAADAEPVQEPQVRGRVWYSAPYIGHLSVALSPEVRAWVARGVGLALVVYAGYVLVRRRPAAEPDA